MMRTRLVLLLVALSLALAPAAGACVAASLLAGASAEAACCCGPAATACSTARADDASRACPCASRDEAPFVPTAPPAPAIDRASGPAGPWFETALDAPLAPRPAGCEDERLTLRFGARTTRASLFVLGCVYRL